MEEKFSEHSNAIPIMLPPAIGCKSMDDGNTAVRLSTHLGLVLVYVDV